MALRLVTGPRPWLVGNILTDHLLAIAEKVRVVARERDLLPIAEQVSPNVLDEPFHAAPGARTIGRRRHAPEDVRPSPQLSSA